MSAVIIFCGLCLGATLHAQWTAHCARKELAAGRAAQRQTLDTLANYAGMLREALELASKQQRDIECLKTNTQFTRTERP